MINPRTRWIIFSSLFTLTILSYLITVKLKIRPSPQVQKTFEYIESLPPSSVIIISFDHEASSLPEIKPITQILLRHAFRQNIRIVGMSLFAEGTAIGYNMLTQTAREFGRIYGQDYVFLGFKPQHISAILGMGESIRGVFPEDYMGNRTDSIPMMKNINNYDSISMVISIADGDRAVQWIEYAGARYNQKILAGLTAAMITTYDPYLNSGQLFSVVGGLKGAAEYETLYGRLGSGSRGLLAQSTTHIFIIALIVIGNIICISEGEREGRGEGRMDVGVIIAGILTLAIYSFLYKDNPVYKMAESLLIGLSVGYTLVIFWQSTLIDLLINPLFGQGKIILVIPLILGLAMFSRFSNSLSWLSRIPLSFMIGAGAGVAIPAMLYARTLKQVSASVAPMIDEAGNFNFSELVVVIGLLSTLSYFYFSRRHEGLLGRSAKVGTYFMMIFFGATFGYTVMSRLSTLIGRVDFLVTDFLHIIK